MLLGRLTLLSSHRFASLLRLAPLHLALFCLAPPRSIGDAKTRRRLSMRQ